MSNFNNNQKKYANVADCSELAAIKALNESLIGNHNYNLGEADEETEKLNLKELSIPAEDIILKESYSEDFLIEQSELENSVFGVFSEIFADIFSVKLMFTLEKGYYFMCSFRYMTEEQFKQKQADCQDTMVRCINSSVEPDAATKTSVAANIMMLVQHQTTNAYDATKYAKVTKEAKELLTNLLYFSKQNQKKKWIKGENYLITNQTGSSFDGRTYSNIIGSVYLDAKKVIAMLGSPAGESKKYEYNIIPITSNVTNTNAMIKIEKINTKTKNYIRNKYGVMFG